MLKYLKRRFKMTDYEKIEQSKSELKYALEFVPKKFHSPNFEDVTSWEAYLNGKIVSKVWTPVTEDGEFQTYMVSNGEGGGSKTFAYVEKYVTYNSVINIVSNENTDPRKSRILAFDAAVWAVRAEDVMNYFWYLKQVEDDLRAIKLSVAGWIFRIIGTLFVIDRFNDLGSLSQSILGFLSKPFEFLLCCLALPLLWFPVYIAFKRRNDNKPKVEEVVKRCEEALRIRDYFLQMQSNIPFVSARHRSGADVDANAFIYIVSLIDQGRACNLAEAQNIYEQDKQAYMMNNHFEEMQRQMTYNNKMTTINTFANILSNK